MSSTRVTLTFGRDTLGLDVPTEFLAGEPVRPRAMPALSPDGIRDRLREALARPKGRPRLGEMVGGRTVAVLVSDEFRAGLHESIIQVLCEELRAGSPAAVTILCATGTHEPELYAAHVREWVGLHAEGLPCRFVAHSCDDPALVPIGVSPRGTPVVLEPAWLAADVRVYGHESKHHYMNGYSLVDKQVIPGISARRTVEANHRRSLSTDSGPGRNPWHTDPARQVNPFGEDARDIRALAERTRLMPDGRLVPCDPCTFALDMISDKGSLFWAGSGDPDNLCRQAIAHADEQAQFILDPVRYVAVSPGGPPACDAMYGVQNCFDMAMKGAVLPGGEVLITAPCDGRPDLPADVRGIATSAASKALFWDNLVTLRHRPLPEALEWIDDHFELYLWKTARVLRNFAEDRLRLFVHSHLPPERLVEAGFEPCADPQAWIDERARRGDGRLRVIDNGNKLFVQARAVSGR
jgi:nickel-dependent lactate racemase